MKVKAWIRLLVVCAVLLGLGSVLWIVLLPGLVTSTIRTKTGFAVQVDRFAVNPFTGEAHISGLVLKNPAGWPEEGFVELRQFRAEVELLSLLGDRFVASEIIVDLPRLKPVRNQSGQLNALAFKDGLTGQPSADQPAADGGKASKFLIRHLVLKFDKLTYADYSGHRSAVKDYNLNLRRDLTEVDSLTEIVSPFTGAALGVMSDAVGRLFKVRPDLLEESVGTLQGAGKKTGETLKTIFQSLEKKKP